MRGEWNLHGSPLEKNPHHVLRSLDHATSPLASRYGRQRSALHLQSHSHTGHGLRCAQRLLSPSSPSPSPAPPTSPQSHALGERLLPPPPPPPPPHRMFIEMPKLWRLSATRRKMFVNKSVIVRYKQKEDSRRSVAFIWHVSFTIIRAGLSHNYIIVIP